MSDASILLGFIEEKNPNYVPDPHFYCRANDAAIAALPDDDPYPPLCRSLFAVTGDDSRHGSFRGERVIHFAGKFNYFLEGLPPRLDKFEGLLRKPRPARILIRRISIAVSRRGDISQCMS